MTTAGTFSADSLIEDREISAALRHAGRVFDAHVQILDPRFPLVENQGVVPAFFTFADYESATADLDITGGVIVSSSFQTEDQRFLTKVLKEVNAAHPGEWVGVAQLDANTPDRSILKYAREGVRGLRFNLKRAKVDIAEMTLLARRAYDLVGWHTEMYVDGKMLVSLQPVIAKIPQLSIDHLGMSTDSLRYVLDLVDRGAKVKASSFGRVDLDVVDAMRQINAVNPHALMWGSDLPGLRARRTFIPADLDLISEAVGGDMYWVLEANARELYRMPAIERPEPPATKPLPIIDLADFDDEPQAANE